MTVPGSQVEKLIYVGDPMCSWCWGFAPEVEDLAADYRVEVVVGGLRPGPMAQPMGEGLARFLENEWGQIAERTGQPFDTSTPGELLDQGWTYDTEPAAIAVVEMRRVRPDDALVYFTRVQDAFYAKGRDVTDFAVLADLAGEFDDSDEFRTAIETESAKSAAWADFSRARSWGIGGFPALVGELEDDRLALFARGWTKATEIRGRISRFEAGAV